MSETTEEFTEEQKAEALFPDKSEKATEETSEEEGSSEKEVEKDSKEEESSSEESSKDSDKDSEDSKDDSDKEGEEEGSPEKYEFKTPDGNDYGEEIVAEFSDIAKENNWTQEQASKILSRLGDSLQKNQENYAESTFKQWKTLVKDDKEIGGENLKETLEIAGRGVEAFGNKELKELFDETGIGSHPEMIRMFAKIGKLVSPDGKVVGNGDAAADAGGLESMSDDEKAEVLFGGTK